MVVGAPAESVVSVGLLVEVEVPDVLLAVLLAVGLAVLLDVDSQFVNAFVAKPGTKLATKYFSEIRQAGFTECYLPTRNASASNTV